VPSNIHVVRNEPDLRTVAALEHLLELARSGQLVGLAFVALQPGEGYSADILGSILNHRLLALGLCRELETLVR